MVKRAKELGMHSLAITDHGGMYGAIDFYRIAKQYGINPIIGCEMYVARGSRHDRGNVEKSPYHLTVLSKDITGYKNLMKMVTKSHLEGFYYKPRIDRELLEEFQEGLIVLSGCPSGEVSKRITEGQLDDAREVALWYKDLLGERYFLELMSHSDVPEFKRINSAIMDLHQDLNIPVVATNDFHYVEKKDASIHDVLLCVQTNSNIDDKNRMKFEEDSYYLKSPQEMNELFADIPEAVTNTEVIANMCSLELDFSELRLPEFKLPVGKTADKYLSELCLDNLSNRLGNVTDKDQERINYELSVIKETKFANYFLVVWDIARFVRDQDIFFCVRGSAAASLVLYCLEVTDINPLKYKLVFERFLNVERKEMPDIDMDFQDDRRGEVIDYVVKKYGWDHVAQIITFGTMGARASLRDVGRALGMPYDDVDKIARLVPSKLHITLDEALEMSTDMAHYYSTDQTIRTLLDTARGLEGLTRHSSTHAAGVVISKEPLNEVVPLQKSTKGTEVGVAMTQYAMDPLAKLGLLKMDFLGLANLTILSKARDLISRLHGVQIVLREIPLDDPDTFTLLSKGETVGVFQLEGSGMTRYIKDLKPNSLGDVAAMIALYRPGPMEHIGTFIQAKHGVKKPQYPHNGLKEILEETYGVIVYQDQVLHIFRTFAGYSLGEADIVRKAMGKKIPEIMSKERENFIAGATRQGYNRKLAEELFALIEPFAGYAFNKAHSVSYGLISYWTAFLKATYTVEYMVSLLNSYVGNTEKINVAIQECRRLKIPVLPPDINKSEMEFTIEHNSDKQRAIRFGMSAVKNITGNSVSHILQTRNSDGHFSSIEQMCKDAEMGSINRKTLESLIKVGVFDEFYNRRALLEIMDRILSLAQSESELRSTDQSSMFEMLGDSIEGDLTKLEYPAVITTDREKIEWEEELLGVSLSNANLVENLIAISNHDNLVYRSQINLSMGGEIVNLTGQIISTTNRLTRNQRPFTIASVGMVGGSLDIFIWDEMRKKTEGLWDKGKYVSVSGKIRARGDQISISCLAAKGVFMNGESINPMESHRPGSINEDYKVNDSHGPDTDMRNSTSSSKENSSTVLNNTTSQTIEPASSSNKTVSRRLNLLLKESSEPEQDNYLMEDVKRLLLEYRGDDEVNLEIVTNGKIVTLEWPLVRVDACPDLEEKLEDILGLSGHVSIQMVMF